MSIYVTLRICIVNAHAGQKNYIGIFFAVICVQYVKSRYSDGADVAA